MQVSRRSLLLTAAAALTTTSAATTDQRLRVGLLTFVLPTGAAPSTTPDGWDWAAEGEQGMQILIRGRTAAPTPELALTAAVRPEATGIVPWSVTGTPPQGVAGADAYRVWSIRSTTEPVRTGVALAATLAGATAVCLVTGSEGWSPSLRRSFLASMEVRREA
ncbi:hypothetical protein FB476_0657 [Ornithinimicrobium humiphilum]|uniref:Secreted protein n=1 Tax=Ornithinimicrobium humiphilum TaxID=125288 RepID=A0A543KL47_9MICO|nr:hypothetical protein [Ornithinimicrobium humiphilum]TQM95807.1 hypothetical protein FB476_0657 [Ornithinimicrobium humiphilum]